MPYEHPWDQRGAGRPDAVDHYGGYIDPRAHDTAQQYWDDQLQAELTDRMMCDQQAGLIGSPMPGQTYAPTSEPAVQPVFQSPTRQYRPSPRPQSITPRFVHAGVLQMLLLCVGIIGVLTLFSTGHPVFAVVAIMLDAALICALQD